MEAESRAGDIRRPSFGPDEPVTHDLTTTGLVFTTVELQDDAASLSRRRLGRGPVRAGWIRKAVLDVLVVP